MEKRVKDDPETRAGSPVGFPENGLVRIKGQAYVFELQTGHCDDASPATCEGEITLTVQTPSGKTLEVLDPRAIIFNAKKPLFEGPLTAGAFVNEGQTLLVSDFDADGSPDLAVRSGTDAAYGGASYDVYLFDPATDQFALNQKLSELTTAPYLGMFLLDGQKNITAAMKSGCCESRDQTYAMRHDNPVLIAWVDRKTSENGEQLTTNAVLRDGKWSTTTTRNKTME